MMDFQSLSYAKLQAECKSRGISAKGKTTELIERLIQSEVPTYADVNPPTANNSDLMSQCFGLSIEEPTPQVRHPIMPPITTGKTEFSVPIEQLPKVVTQKQINIELREKRNQQFTSVRKTNNFDIEMAWSDIGFWCINNSSLTTGIEAVQILRYLWNKHSLSDHIFSYTEETRLYIEFDVLRELTQARKVIKAGRNLTPAKIELGKEKRKAVTIQPDKGSTFGLQSEHRQPYKSGVSQYLLDYKLPTKLYIGKPGVGKKIIEQQTNVTSLKTQADNKNNNGGYPSTIKCKLPKMSTGTKLPAKIQSKIDTSHISKAFIAPTLPDPAQIQLLSSGVIVLKLRSFSGYKDMTIGHLTDYYYQGDKLVFNWNYFSYTLKYKCEQLDSAINKHLGKDRQETLHIVSKQNNKERSTDESLTLGQKMKLARKKQRKQYS